MTLIVALSTQGKQLVFWRWIFKCIITLIDRILYPSPVTLMCILSVFLWLFIVWFERKNCFLRSWLMLSAQTNIHGEYSRELQALTKESSQALLLEQCPQGNYSVRCSSWSSRDMYLYPQVNNFVMSTYIICTYRSLLNYLYF